MKHCKQDEELANTGPRPFPSKEPNPVTLQAIREADAFFSDGGVRSLRQRRRSWSRAQTWCKSVLRSVAANPDVTPS